ncbi:hypothetical protein [Crystallibacter degradans]|uniref:hypothetical protein n=1 Tax=Crystallibacter degradans TaxID=2726743 RepID=UPI001475B652|nr:hypothetical protein [Arthrobacter sp. SF27]NMR31395.1 hypothetical protein [Arthrobacter sp. SF27]
MPKDPPPVEGDQSALIQWLSENGVKVPEGVPEPGQVFMSPGTIHFNVYGLDDDGLVTIEAEAPLLVPPPDELKIAVREP